MAYVKDTLISLPPASGQTSGGSMGDFWTTLTAGLSAAANSQAATTSSTRALQQAIAAQQNQPGIGTYALIGGLGVAAYLMLRKKKPKASASP